MRSMGATSSPAVRLRRALDAGSLTLAEATARESQRIELDDALGICLLMGASGDARFERAAVRWAGRLCMAHPEVGFADAHRTLTDLQNLRGASPPLARSDLARSAQRAEH
jgi:hypothetical protein